MADIAAQMGMSQGNLYLYIRSKRDLYEKSVIQALYKFEKFMVEALQTEEDAVRQIIAMSEAGFVYISDNEDLRAVIINDEGLLLRPLEEIFSSENVENYAEDYEFSKNILEKCLKQIQVVNIAGIEKLN